MKKYLPYLLAGISLALGLFFIYKGLNKHWLSPCKVYGPESSIPPAYIQLITALCQSGFLKVVGSLQILSGVLLLIPKTRLLGAVLLLPIILNIFLIHLFLDNRPEELVETGIPLLLTLLVLAMTAPNWRHLLLSHSATSHS